MKFVTLDKLKQYNADYNILIGERSNGKTYCVLLEIIRRYVETGEAGAIIRRYEDDFARGRGQNTFAALVKNSEIFHLTGGAWTDIRYRSRRWYLCKWDEELDKIVEDQQPFCYAFSLSGMEHDKSSSYPDVTTILFDEFLTREKYLIDEFILFTNTLSTIIRQRDNVKIYMCGNTVSQSSIYYSEMGLHRIKNMNPGEIDVYTYGESNLKVAVYFTDRSATKKTSSKYFAFNNPRLNMITGTGSVWELAVHPHCPAKYTPKDIAYRFIIEWDGITLMCELVNLTGMKWIQIHRKTTPIKDPDTILIYSPEPSMARNRRENILHPVTQRERIILGFFARGKVAYQDNEVGELVHHYLNWCGKK